ncbi:protein kinase domain-containing protein [Streptomyces alkaliterrae]|uniref:non-specific serine/threonine protein kinase n=1 Tax=Streptomyces alkaliterrae TaxID=2213162 RepID=A0A5P0YX51_9ACTN|nr:protein kinase [Streptomyces alkaliterrae]MBB1258441.1 serine/threonine protein kinase [Streptomyces alkaliterrae]MQS04167.1 protein kinase [Streptomyces alkaliterrae]
MAQTHSAGGPADPDEPDNGAAGQAGMFGNNGLVGDGRYRLTGRLGRGGMAEVFAAEDVRLGRTVAVKLLRSDLAEDPVSKARFTREAQSVAGLNHHAVVAVYDSGEDEVDGSVVPYIVMELVKGKTIRDLLATSEAPPPEQALIIVSGVLEALAYSHQHGIVHRDIKPANVIITDSGAVKVMDFGIARALHGASQTMTQTGMVMGTPQYLSPEQALGKAVDARSDLYATGCLLYELLTQRPPFTGETPLSVVYQHVQDDPVPPSEVHDDVPPELDGLVMRSLAKEPDDRFQSAEEMRGLTQYGLRQLQEQGGHTGGLWNTGPVLAGGTPAMGTPSAGPGYDEAPTTVGPPMLLGRPDGDDGGFEGGPRREGGRGGGVKYALIAFFAVLAVALGVYFAINNTGEGKGNTTDPSPSPSVQETEKEKSPSPDPTPTDEETDDANNGWTPPPSYNPPAPPQNRPSTPQNSGTPSEPTTGGNTEGNADGGHTEGTNEGATEGNQGGGDNGGGDNGGADGGGGDPGGGDASGGGGDPTGGGGDPGGGSGDLTS